MKKISLLFALLLACGMNAVAQTVVPKPLNPDPTQLDWIDYEPYQHDDGDWAINSQFMVHYGMDIMGNLVADDYYFDIDEVIVGECNYTKLDPENFSYSIYTDFDRIYTFTPEKYDEFTEPTTNVPYLLGSTDNGTFHFEHWFVHFEKETNNVEGIEGMKRFFYWRIGIQTHYTIDGVTNSSDIVYLEVFDKPEITGDVNQDQKVDIEDVNQVINIILEQEDYIIWGDMDENGKIDIEDMNAIINVILSQE